MLPAGPTSELVTLQRFDSVTDAWVNLAHAAQEWAAPTSQGEGRFELRIRHRRDLRTKADVEGAMRVLMRGDEYDLVDVVEVDWHETRLTIARRIVEPFEEIKTGTRRLKVWP